ncbi:MAG: elongation factor P [Candidatus Roizmanbacteria bacterium]
MKTSAGNLKKGEFVMYQDDIWQVQKAEFYSPGKGAALMKAKIKNLVSGKNVDYTFKSNEDVDVLDVSVVEMQYLYKDAEFMYLMDERTYNQYQLPLPLVGEVINYIKDGTKHYVYVYNDKPLNIRPPLSVRLKIIDTEEAVKGDTVSGAKKPAIVETGVTVMVPLFVKKGDMITVNPETGVYGERVKE